MVKLPVIVSLAALALTACGGSDGTAGDQPSLSSAQANRPAVQVNVDCPKSYRSITIAGSVIDAPIINLSLSEVDAELSYSIAKELLPKLYKVCFGATEKELVDGQTPILSKTYEVLAYAPDGTPFDFKQLSSQTLTVRYSRDKIPEGTDAAVVLTAVNIFTGQNEALTARPQVSNDLSATDNTGTIKANLDGAGRYVVGFKPQ